MSWRAAISAWTRKHVGCQREHERDESDLCASVGGWWRWWSGVDGGGGFDVSKKGPANRKACLFQEAESEGRGWWRGSSRAPALASLQSLAARCRVGWVCSGTDQGSAPAPPSSSLRGKPTLPSSPVPSPAQPLLGTRSTTLKVGFLLWPAGTPLARSKFALGHWRHAAKGKREKGKAG